jgi:tetratricopeptide (TPR) repeat protein
MHFRGIAEAELGCLDAARRHFQEAIAISRTAEDADGEGQTLNNLGEVLRRSGDAAGAITLYRRDLELSRSRHDIRAMAICLDNIGKAELDQGLLNAATRTLTEALTVARSGDAMIVEAEILRDLGTAAAAADDMPAADDHYRPSSELYERLGDPAGVVETMIRHAETVAPHDSAFFETLRDDAGRLLPKLGEPFSGRLERRLDTLIEEMASRTRT